MTCWRTKGDSNRRYSSENISLRCRPNFRSCAAKWPAEKNPQKGAKIWFAPRSHGPVLGQRNGAIMQFLSSGHIGCILRPFDGDDSPNWFSSKRPAGQPIDERSPPSSNPNLSEQRARLNSPWCAAFKPGSGTAGNRRKATSGKCFRCVGVNAIERRRRWRVVRQA